MISGASEKLDNELVPYLVKSPISLRLNMNWGSASR